MLRGLATTTFYADDMAAAREWYTKLFGFEPYFERSGGDIPGYMEWRIGDSQDEFGIVNRVFAPHAGSTEPAGAVVMWHVDDVAAAIERLNAMGARTYETPTQRGEGFVTASVVDPFGNILGIMYNPHYLEILAASQPMSVGSTSLNPS